MQPAGGRWGEAGAGQQGFTGFGWLPRGSTGFCSTGFCKFGSTRLYRGSVLRRFYRVLSCDGKFSNPVEPNLAEPNVVEPLRTPSNLAQPLTSAQHAGGIDACGAAGRDPAGEAADDGK